MRSPQPRRIAILAGGGSLPREIAARLVAKGAYVHIIAIAGAAEISPPPPCPVTVVDFAQIGKILGILKEEALCEMLIIGAVNRPDLRTLRPDFGFFLALPGLLHLVSAGGDDAVLRGVIAFFEQRGIRIVGVPDVAPELIVAGGPLGRHTSQPQHQRDIAVGLAIIRCLAPFDVGQAVVVADGRVETIEGVEGTDAMLKRASVLRTWRRKNGCEVTGGVLVKSPKAGQELRIDLPTIGPNTIRGIVDAQLEGIAATAGYVLMAQSDELRREAEASRIFVEGVAAGMAVRPPVTAAPPFNITRRGRIRPTNAQRLDCIKAAQVIAALQREDIPTGLVFVHRSHVLAVETGEGIEGALERGADLRQWGRNILRRRAGVAVLARSADLDKPLMARAAAAGLAGLAVIVAHSASFIDQPLIDEANRHGMFVATLSQDQGAF